MPPGTDQRPYTHEMVVVHRVFRREADLLPRIVRAVPEADKAAIRRTAAAIDEYIGGLHHHHALEDELIWPKLEQRSSDTARLEVEVRMREQHSGIEKSLTAVGDALTLWRATGNEADARELAAAFDAHRVALVEHLDDEENLALPLVAEHLTVEEWNTVGDRGLERLPRNKLLLALGAILEDATPQEQSYFLSKAPRAGRLAWRLIGRRQYAARCRELRAPLQP